MYSWDTQVYILGVTGLILWRYPGIFSGGTRVYNLVVPGICSEGTRVYTLGVPG